MSANESYARAAEAIAVLTGVAVSHRPQQRLGHRQTLELPPVATVVEAMRVDGGKVRLRTPKGEPSAWRDDKAVKLHEHSVGAFFQAHTSLVHWVKAQPLAAPLICLGAGHDGIWNFDAAIGTSAPRRELLDWYHWVETLGKVGGSQQR